MRPARVDGGTVIQSDTCLFVWGGVRHPHPISSVLPPNSGITWIAAIDSITVVGASNTRMTFSSDPDA